MGFAQGPVIDQRPVLLNLLIDERPCQQTCPAKVRLLILDTQGKDSYGPSDILDADYRGRTIADSRSWHYRNDVDELRGFATDVDWYPAPKQE